VRRPPALPLTFVRARAHSGRSRRDDARVCPAAADEPAEGLKRGSPFAAPSASLPIVGKKGPHYSICDSGAFTSVRPSYLAAAWQARGVPSRPARPRGVLDGGVGLSTSPEPDDAQADFALTAVRPACLRPLPPPLSNPWLSSPSVCSACALFPAGGHLSDPTAPADVLHHQLLHQVLRAARHRLPRPKEEAAGYVAAPHRGDPSLERRPLTPVCAPTRSLPARLPPLGHRRPVLHPARGRDLGPMGRHHHQPARPRHHVLLLLCHGRRQEALGSSGHRSPAAIGHRLLLPPTDR
jgi:hypothetical protein